jgi:hypothetical protein
MSPPGEGLVLVNRRQLRQTISMLRDGRRRPALPPPVVPAGRREHDARMVLSLGGPAPDDAVEVLGVLGDEGPDVPGGGRQQVAVLPRARAGSVAASTTL